jgi:hypothetical protein
VSANSKGRPVHCGKCDERYGTARPPGSSTGPDDNWVVIESRTVGEDGTAVTDVAVPFHFPLLLTCRHCGATLIVRANAYERLGRSRIVLPAWPD